MHNINSFKLYLSSISYVPSTVVVVGICISQLFAGAVSHNTQPLILVGYKNMFV